MPLTAKAPVASSPASSTNRSEAQAGRVNSAGAMAPDRGRAASLVAEGAVDGRGKLPAASAAPQIQETTTARLIAQVPNAESPVLGRVPQLGRSMTGLDHWQAPSDAPSQIQVEAPRDGREPNAEKRLSARSSSSAPPALSRAVSVREPDIDARPAKLSRTDRLKKSMSTGLNQVRRGFTHQRSRAEDPPLLGLAVAGPELPSSHLELHTKTVRQLPAKPLPQPPKQAGAGSLQVSRAEDGELRKLYDEVRATLGGQPNGAEFEFFRRIYPALQKDTASQAAPSLAIGCLKIAEVAVKFEISERLALGPHFSSLVTFLTARDTLMKSCDDTIDATFKVLREKYPDPVLGFKHNYYYTKAIPTLREFKAGLTSLGEMRSDQPRDADYRVTAFFQTMTRSFDGSFVRAANEYNAALRQLDGGARKEYFEAFNPRSSENLFRFWALSHMFNVKDLLHFTGSWLMNLWGQRAR